MKTLFLFSFLFITVPIYCQNKAKALKDQDHNLNLALKSLFNDKDLKNASIGFLAIDTKTGETVAELNPDLSLMPASTQKIITTAAAYEVLGKNFRFTTNLQYSGIIDTIKNILEGDIYIKGGGDPTLGSRYFDSSANFFFVKTWIDCIKKLKINTIKGRIIADASIYGTEITPPKWSWEDVANYYGAGANGLSVFDDLYEIHFNSPSTADSLTTISKIDPEIPGLSLYNEVLSSNSKKDEAFVFGAPYSYQFYVRGTIPKSKSDFIIKGAIPDPAYFMAWYFDKELKKEGIAVNGEPTTDRILKNKGDSMSFNRTDIHTYFSPGLKNIIDVTNKKSINLFAEHLFNHIAFKIKSSGTNSAAIDAMKEFWKNKGMDTDGFYIYDGCGLSRYNSVTPRQLVFILNYMLNKSKYFTEFFESLPVAGESGTLKSVGVNTSAHGLVHAKSGSIGRVRAYTGYVTSKSGRMLAFSMNLANYNCSDSDARDKLASLMVEMANFDL